MSNLEDFGAKRNNSAIDLRMAIGATITDYVNQHGLYKFTCGWPTSDPDQSWYIKSGEKLHGPISLTDETGAYREKDEVLDETRRLLDSIVRGTDKGIELRVTLFPEATKEVLSIPGLTSEEARLAHLCSSEEKRNVFVRSFIGMKNTILTLGGSLEISLESDPPNFSITNGEKTKTVFFGGANFSDERNLIIREDDAVKQLVQDLKAGNEKESAEKSLRIYLAAIRRVWW